MAELSPKVKIMAARGAAISRVPYFRAAMLRVQFAEVAAEDLPYPTMAMSPGGVIYYCVEFVQKTPTAQLASVLVHELMHFLQAHHTRFKSLIDMCIANEDSELRTLLNIAEDCEINDDLTAMGWSLPADCAFPQKYDLEPGKTAEQYLLELRKNQTAAPKQPKTGNGQCGGAAGHGHDVEKRFAPGDKPGSAGKSPATGSGELQKPTGMSEGEVERLRAQVARDVNAHAQQQGGGRGTIPQGIARWAADHIKPPKVPWRQKLARATRRALEVASGMQDYRYDGISRRQSGLGHGPNAPRLPRLRGYLPRIAVVVDTSGSMSNAQLGLAISETSGILRAAGAAVTFCAIDTALHDAPKQVRNWQEAAASMKGGGGTDMRPAFEALRMMKNRPNVVICATDGMIGDPGPEPTWCRVIWLLVGSKYTHDVSKFGEIIEVDAAEGL